MRNHVIEIFHCFKDIASTASQGNAMKFAARRKTKPFLLKNLHPTRIHAHIHHVEYHGSQHDCVHPLSLPLQPRLALLEPLFDPFEIDIAHPILQQKVVAFEAQGIELPFVDAINHLVPLIIHNSTNPTNKPIL